MDWIRVASSQRRGWNLFKTLLQTAFLWTTALWIIPRTIYALQVQGGGVGLFAAQPLAGWAILVAASGLGLWSGITMAWYGEGTPLPLDTARRFVVEGPYTRLRNPMAVAGLSQGAGVGLVLGSWMVLAYVLAGGVLWQLLARPVEEADLEQRFGDAYRQYRAAVPCWRPVWKAYRIRAAIRR
jgi:protein-S-isoprenylcysteine O-methyltransferase Ste14